LKYKETCGQGSLTDFGSQHDALLERVKNFLGNKLPTGEKNNTSFSHKRSFLRMVSNKFPFGINEHLLKALHYI